MVSGKPELMMGVHIGSCSSNLTTNRVNREAAGAGFLA